MPASKKRSILTGVTVKQAMRAQVVSLPADSTIRDGIRRLIKYKINGLLLTDRDERPIGVVTKTDVMAAYYTELPIDAPLGHIMMSPTVFCHPEDTLESALDTMRANGIYRLFVTEDPKWKAIGVLAYPDIVGLIYQYCHDCRFSVLKRRTVGEGIDEFPRMRVRDVMTSSVTSFSEFASLVQIVEALSVNRFTAVLITATDGAPAGVISKTDLILAYMRGIGSQNEAKKILWSPRVISCDETTFLEVAIQQMVLSDRQRLFVSRSDPKNIIGVFSISDAARARSGSCQACMSSRIAATHES